MATVWLRHPRYSLLIFVSLITTFYLLFLPHEHDQPIQPFHVQDNSLETRVQLSHSIYDKLLAQREGLLKKFGPNPKDIALCVAVSLFVKLRSELFPPVSLLTRILGLLTPCVSCNTSRIPFYI
jgi:hypothetical protein